MIKTQYLPLVACIGLLFISSCKRDFLESIQSAEDNAQIETEFSQIFETFADFAATDGRTAKTDDYLLPNGAVVTFTDSLFNDGDGIDFHINYGSLNSGGSYKGRLCKDGRYRSGVVHVGMTARWSEIPCVITIAISSTDQYFAGNGVKMYQLTGTKTITKTSATSYNVEVLNATLQRDNGTVSWNAERTVTKTNDPTPGWQNDEYTITGSADGINANGDAFTAETTTPLVKLMSLGCMSTFITGKIAVTNSNGKVLSIDYDSFGDAACDKTATVYYNNRSRNITLW
jgi:hypothetical protein